jgi:hypothetical protein
LPQQSCSEVADFTSITLATHNTPSGTPNITIAYSPNISLAACDSHNPFPEVRRQLLPARDQLAQGEISAGSMQTGGRCVNATLMLHNDLRISGRVCNMRREAMAAAARVALVIVTLRTAGRRLICVGSTPRSAFEISTTPTRFFHGSVLPGRHSTAPRALDCLVR